MLCWVSPYISTAIEVRYGPNPYVCTRVLMTIDVRTLSTAVDATGTVLSSTAVPAREKTPDRALTTRTKFRPFWPEKYRGTYMCLLDLVLLNIMTCKFTHGGRRSRLHVQLYYTYMYSFRFISACSCALANPYLYCAACTKLSL